MKELLEGFLSRLETESKPKEGEYLGEDGLLVIHRCSAGRNSLGRCGHFPAPANAGRRRCAGRKKRMKPENG